MKAMIRSGGLAALLMSLVAWAHAADAPPPAPTTTADVKVATDELNLLCKPLTQAELKIEADGWQKLLHDKVKEISQAEIALGKSKDAEEKSKLVDQVTKLTEERVQILDRLNAVLAAYRAKGGKSDDYDTYANAVSGVQLKVNDAGTAYKTLLNWVKSPEGGIRYGKNIGLFIATLIVFRIIANIAATIVGRAMGAFKKVSNLLRDFAANTMRNVVFFVGFVMALSMLEVNIGPFLAAMGAAGFVIGFALQGTLSNFAAGVMILLYRPYDIGDEVTVAGATGRVDSMTLVSTVVRNKEGHTVTIPNSAIWGGTITNLSDAKPA